MRVPQVIVHVDEPVGIAAVRLLAEQRVEVAAVEHQAGSIRACGDRHGSVDAGDVDQFTEAALPAGSVYRGHSIHAVLAIAEPG